MLSRLTRQRAVAAAIACIFVAALAVEYEARPTRNGRSATDLAGLSSSDVRRIAGRVERLRDLRFTRPVRPLFVSREHATQMVEQANERDYPAERRRLDEQQLKLLGLLDAGDSLDRVARVIEGEQILGFYDPKTKRLVVIRHARAGRALLEMTLAHELVHALEDQHFGLEGPSDPGDDGALAYSSMVEGSATQVMGRYAERYLDPADLLAIVLAADTGTELPTYVEHALLFPYEQGLSFVQTFRGELTPGGRGSWGAFDSLLVAKRAESTEQILHPRRFAFGERPRRVEMPELEGLHGAGWKRLDSQAVGEFDLRQLFEIVAGKAAPAAAEGWGGGRFEIWRRGGERDCEGGCVEQSIGVLRVVWDSERDRVEAEPQMRRAIEGGLKGERIGAGSGVGLWSSRGGAIGMRSSCEATTIVLAPDRPLAARLLAKGV